MSDAEIGQMRNGLGLSGKQLERYQTQRSIVIKKQADLVNCSALGSLAIEKGFETTVDKLLKELLKKAAGAVGGALGGAAAISGGIVIGMLLSTEEVGESKEELDEFVKEQEEKKKKENETGKDSGGNKKGDSKDEEADYVKDNRVPQDKETVLGKKDYQKTGKKVKGAQVYKKGDKYYYRDTFHTGKSAHIEVFDKRGHHLGEADPLTGIIKPGTADPTKIINVK